ncbi:MAG TPA: tetratricopeptide repeat protein [Ferruginibacter sp.]|nr:tetratricopeptide repeat protein [Ferruginibacter sp.]
MKPALLALLLLLSTTCSIAQRELKNPLIDSKQVLEKGSELFQDGKFKEAIDEYLKVPVSDTNYSDVVKELINSYYRDSNYTAAEQYSRKALDYFPEKKVIWLRYLADIYDDTKRTQEALSIYDSILKMSPHDYLSFYNRGVCLYRLERRDEATADFQQCVIYNPFYPQGHYFLGLCAMQKGNLVQSMLSFSTSLMVYPGNRNYKRTFTLMSSISEVNTLITELLKKYQAGKEDDFESIQDILVSKIALDKKYKLKVDLEDQIVRQLQVIFEKLEYNPNDKGFWMQYYVPLYKKIWDEKAFEPFINHICSELSIEKVKDYMKKEKKKVEALSTLAVEYLSQVRKTNQVDYTKRASTRQGFYIKNYLVAGKGELAVNEKNDELMVGPWEFYYPGGQVKSKGVYDKAGLRHGTWTFYYENGRLKEISIFKDDKAEGKSESWYDNGLPYVMVNYTNDERDGLEKRYYFNGNLMSEITYKKGLKEGPARYYEADGPLSSTCTYVNDLKEGEEITYFRSGKISSKSNYVKDESSGNYTEYHENGKLKRSGLLKEGKYSGPWKWYFDNGQTEYICNYEDGEFEGEFLSFYANGKPETRCSYKQGKVDGKKEYFDDDGIIYNETIFEKGRLRDIRFFDKKGNVIGSTSSRKGNANIVFFAPDGSKSQEGYFSKDGYQEGKGVTYYKNGTISSESNYKNGMLEGKKTSYYANGKISREQEYSNDSKNGYSVSYHQNGTVSEEGWYVNDERQGTFLSYNQLGQVTSKLYYLNDKIHGEAVYLEANGKISHYEYYQYGWLMKIAQLDTLGNTVAKAELEKGEARVQFKYQNGKPYFESNYKHYNLEGPYRVFYGDGSRSSLGYYKYGNSDSTYTAWFNNGKPKIEGRYKNLERDGIWKYYFRDGGLSQTEPYVNGKLEGKGISYNEDGTVDKEYNYKNGNMDGPCIYYGENKQVALVIYYKDDEVIGYSYEDKSGNLLPMIPIVHGTGKIVAYFRNGKKSAEIQMSESVAVGDRVLYYSNGNVYVSGKRVNGNDDGVKKIYYASGKLMKEENYLNGNLHGTSRFYNENGSLKWEQQFWDGEANGVFNYYEGGKITETHYYYYGSLQSVKK